MSAIKFRPDASSPWQELPLLRGPQGEKGDNYTITAADYDAIADVVLTKLPSAEEVSY